MEGLIPEFFTKSNDFVYNHHSKPVNPRLSGEIYTPGSLSGNLVPTEEEEEGDSSDATLKYISQMLMEEEDLKNRPCMLRDCMVLQATEKYFSDVLNGSDDNFQLSISSLYTESPPAGFFGSGISNCSFDINNADSESYMLSPQFQSSGNGFADSFLTPFESQYGLKSVASRGGNGENDLGVEETERDHSPSKGKRNHEYSPHNDSADTQRSNKHLASYSDESEQLEMYDDVLLYPRGRNITCPSETQHGRNQRGKKQEIKKEFVDLRGLLTQCAQSVAINDNWTANKILKKIRAHSSPHGNGTERMAFCLANALEARLNGTGTSLYASNHPHNIPAADMLKAYQMYITASPFKIVAETMANKCIRKLAAGAPRLHIIDFGILYGFQWPSLIQGLSTRPDGPPRLRITGIDFPQPGFRPAEWVEATGLRLDKCCKRFNVPFEYKSIAKKWETIKLEELEIDREDVLVVNCMCRLGNVPDETVVPSSPRDIVLDLIKNINPDVFIHGIANGKYNCPFFVTRFQEALFHFSSLFDMFEVTVPHEDKNRRLFEEILFGREALNVIACEGTERVERPETYKEWQVRSLRAGFCQLRLDQEMVKCVRDKVKSEYDKNFFVDEDGNWLLQGWKGRVINAISYWKPIN